MITISLNTVIVLTLIFQALILIFLLYLRAVIQDRHVALLSLMRIEIASSTDKLKQEIKTAISNGVSHSSAGGMRQSTIMGERERGFSLSQGAFPKS